VAEEVQEFYERYPYPPPADNLERYRRVWDDQQRRRAEYRLLWPGRRYRDDPFILVAGCGTSQAAKYALRWPAAKVMGIDVSATSIRCTRELRRTHGLTNLQLHQLPIERAADLATPFNLIVCTGVLHHLADPDAGLAALRDVLAPGGTMHLMVYAPYGRTGVYMLQEFCRRLGLRATDADIHDLASALRTLPSGHPLETLLRNAPDFRDEAALADAMLHPQDRAYSIPQLFRFIQDGRLVFGRWIRQAPYSPNCGVVARLPLAPRLTLLPLSEQYAAVELFRGTMVRHSLIAYRDDDDAAARSVSFAGEAWRDYVPVRSPDTTCVQERLPPGAAAVLINRAHTDRDLFLPISATEKLWFDAIDGAQSIQQIGGTREFFERLWWHDQVVFDTSPCAQTCTSM
jgi:SAM-dependent methyltransferase